jgi:REP element-mobilizing transposase RayT
MVEFIRSSISTNKGIIMSRDELLKGRYSESHRAYFITTVLAERERRYFSEFDCARLVVAQMRALHEDGAVNSLAWVVMPDHVHWLFQLGEKVDLSGVIKCFKARSAKRVNAYLHRQGSLWQKGFYDHALREEEELQDIARYIVANPLRAGLVEHVGDYPLWDAVWV